MKKINCEYGAFHFEDPIEHYVQAINEIFWNKQSLKVCDNCLIYLKTHIKKIDKIVENKTGWIRKIMKYNAHDLQLVKIKNE